MLKKILLVLIICSTSSQIFANNTVIKAGTRTPAQNTLHQSYCTQIGGIDVTDDSDVSLGENTLDAVFCKIVDKNKYQSSLGYSSAGSFNSDGSLAMLSENSINNSVVSPNGTWSAEAANATVPFNVLWWVRGVGHFNNIEHQTIYTEINVPDFKCAASNSTTNFTGTGILAAQVTCSANISRSWTTDFAKACVNGSCAQATGYIYFK